MKALVLEEYNKLVYKDVPDPVIKSHEVLVKVKACGICGSDVHGLDGSTGRRIPPMIMGHEASGIIVKTGTDVKGWKVGDRVTFDSTVYPLDDWYTLNGHYNLSDNREVLGVSPGTYKRDGAFAESDIHSSAHIYTEFLKTSSFEQAAMVEAVAVALHSINISEISPGDKCVVVGAGHDRHISSSSFSRSQVLQRSLLLIIIRIVLRRQFMQVPVILSFLRKKILQGKFIASDKQQGS